ncbi:spore germination protein [Paenibacillus hamazuiensis]|uniref:spore germination protein n=1 Tax=Paenibacillus hamazuiensis TaxID=2936508 RepID=UPI00200F56A3|nr:spore germination protein [Paenibacillus hamazuiensis]
MSLTDGQMNVVFNKISVISVDTGAGIFIGNNTAYGWTTTRKDNYGFGSSRGGNIHHNCNLVFDNDHIDFPIDDHDVYIHHQTAPAAQHIHFQSVEVNSVSANSTIAVGDNNQPGWNSTGKSNAGAGSFKGLNVSKNNVNTILDDDLIDSPVLQNTASISRMQNI